MKNVKKKVNKEEGLLIIFQGEKSKSKHLHSYLYKPYLRSNYTCQRTLLFTPHATHSHKFYSLFSFLSHSSVKLCSSFSYKLQTKKKYTKEPRPLQELFIKSHNKSKEPCKVCLLFQNIPKPTSNTRE